MKIILQESVEKLGTRGAVVEVAEGYARNYLLPRDLAIPATPGNLRRLEKIRTTLSKREATEREAATQVAAALAGITLTIARKAGESEQLFGSVTTADIAEALEAKGFKIDKRRIQLDEPIKLIGEYKVPVKLFHDITQEVAVTVVAE